jgi:GTP 3',8-cyclase
MDYNIDGHKLIYHSDRVSEFLEKGDSCPLYMEISPIGSCNHRCIFCAYDFIGHPNRKLEYDRLLVFIDEIKQAGVKSILYAGEGEPLLHPDIDKFIFHSRDRGIDVGLFTNGHFLKEGLAETILPLLTFIRFSFNGGTKDNYAVIHKVKPDVFGRVLSNIEKAVEVKGDKGLSVDIGVQFVLLPENISFLNNAVGLFKNIGIDYFVIKPFVQQSHLQSYKIEKQFDMVDIKYILDEAVSLSDENYQVIARGGAFEGYGKRAYKHCYGTSFISVLNSVGDLATCLPYWDKEDYVYGNIYDNTFEEIWIGEKRKRIKELLENKIDVRECPPNCRPNAINEYLWEIKHPSMKHLNFI